MCQGMTALRTQGMELGRAYRCGLLATVYGQVGQSAEGLRLLSEALASEVRSNDAELYRLKGELTLQTQFGVRGAESEVPTSQSPDPKSQAEAEAYFLKAIEVARHQQAKSWELRATTSLARLWQQQGKTKKDHKMLSEIYNWFTEGFDTKDLQEAKALLKELSH